VNKYRSFYVQQLGSAGTAAALEVTKQLMVGNGISSEDATEIFSTLNNHVRVASNHVLRQLLVGDFTVFFLTFYSGDALDRFQVKKIRVIAFAFLSM